MSLKINSVINAQNPDSEIVWLQASAKINLKGYALVDRTFDEKGKISNEFRHIFIFPDLEINSGEWVRLYTGNGKYSTSKTTKNEIIHNLYWQSSSCVWNDAGGDTASLIKYTSVNSVIVPAVKK